MTMSILKMDPTDALERTIAPEADQFARLSDAALRDEARKLNQGFSLAERERRWRVVRRNMQALSLDCLVVPRAVGGVNLCLSLEQVRGAWSDVRYLSLLEDASLVFFADARSPIAVSALGGGSAWIDDSRSPDQRGTSPTWPLVVDILREEGLERGRIGVVGMSGGIFTHTRAFDGVVAHSAFAGIRRALPRATFIDATDVLGLARSQKGEEEIRAIAVGAAIADRVIETVRTRTFPGIDEARLYSIAMERLLELGSEYYSLGFRTGPIGVRYVRIVEPRRGHIVSPDTFFQFEFDALVGGLISQEAQPFVYGDVPALWRRMVDLQRQLWVEGLAMIKPGAFLGDVIDHCRGFARTHGLNSSDVLMHGRGYGNDGPLITPSDPPTPRLRAFQFEPGNVFVWKPTVGMDLPGRRGNDAANRFGWGGNVLVTERGAVRLSTRAHGLVSVK